jgi:hypothetical protein
LIYNSGKGGRRGGGVPHDHSIRRGKGKEEEEDGQETVMESVI